MGKCPSYKSFITITIDKDVLKVMDGVIEFINSKQDEKSPKLTRSKFIQDIIVGFISDVDNDTKQKQEKENNNA